MERFLAVKNKAGRNVTARQRHAEFVGWTHVSGEKLFCTPCNLVLDHSRKSSVEIHKKSGKHKRAEDRQAEEFAERSFSIYNLVFSERRRSLNEDNLRALVFLYYNNVNSYESLM